MKGIILVLLFSIALVYGSSIGFNEKVFFQHVEKIKILANEIIKSIAKKSKSAE